MITEIKCECLDILCDVLHKFGNLMVADHELVLSALLSQLSYNQASVRKKTVACIGKSNLITSILFTIKKNCLLVRVDVVLCIFWVLSNLVSSTLVGSGVVETLFRVKSSKHFLPSRIFLYSDLIMLTFEKWFEFPCNYNLGVTFDHDCCISKTTDRKAVLLSL